MPSPIAAIIAQIGVPVLAKTLGSSLKKIDNSIARTASEALDNLDEIFKNGKISPEQIEELNRHTEKMAEIMIQEKNITLYEINKSLRKEISSDDAYVRRMRPTFGYLMAITWSIQMISLAYIIIFETSKAHIILQAMESLGTIWAVALSVLGIYVYKRSSDKYQLGKFIDTISPPLITRTAIKNSNESKAGNNNDYNSFNN